jgi:RNA polymerase sigma-70 factor (ECF subfamily)
VDVREALGVGRSRAARPGAGGRVIRFPASRRQAAGEEPSVDESGIQALLERARAGDEVAFGELFRSLEPDVHRLCTRLLGSADEARDATSEAFLRARGGLDGYDPDRPFRRWLLAVAAHHCVDRLRRRRREERLFDPRELDASELASPGPSPLQGLLRAEARREVLTAVEALEDRHRFPLVLRYYAELDYTGIAECLGVTRNQVATLLFRARRRLREELAGSAASGASS